MKSRPYQIQSIANDNFKILRSLLSSSGIKKNKQFLFSGDTIVQEFLQSSARNGVPSVRGYIIRGIGQDSEFESGVFREQLENYCEKNQISHLDRYELSRELFGEIDVLGTHSPILLFDLPELTHDDLSGPAADGLELLLPLSDPQNLGAAVRSGVAFHAKKIILLKESSHAFLPKSLKSSAGAILFAPLFYGPSLHDVTNADRAMDASGTSLADLSFLKNERLLIGHESMGLGQAQVKQLVQIPTQGVESLNATVALSIYLYARQVGIK